MWLNHPYLLNVGEQERQLQAYFSLTSYSILIIDCCAPLQSEPRWFSGSPLSVENLWNSKAPLPKKSISEGKIKRGSILFDLPANIPLIHLNLQHNSDPSTVSPQKRAWPSPPITFLYEILPCAGRSFCEVRYPRGLPDFGRSKACGKHLSLLF